MLPALKQKFLDYHQSREFKIYESFPLIIDDPTILFTNATVSPFKTMFTGTIKRERYALVQKCLRLGGTGGDLETPRSNANYTSLFEMLGSGIFDIDKYEAVRYFVELLKALGLSEERLIFTAMPGFGFSSALERAGVASHQVHLFDSSVVGVQNEWSFGEGDLHGRGVTARYAPCGHVRENSATVLRELDRYIQIGRIVHIDGAVRGSSIEPFPYEAYDMGIGLNRVELALNGNCELSMQPWRTVSHYLQHSIPGLSSPDAHYMANLYRVTEDLVGEGLVPGNKRHAYALRKVIRSLIEETWLQAGRLIEIPHCLRQPIKASAHSDRLTAALAQEELALRRTLAIAGKEKGRNPGMSPEELRATFGIRDSLLHLHS